MMGTNGFNLGKFKVVKGKYKDNIYNKDKWRC